MSFTSSSRKWFSRKLQNLRGQSLRPADPKALLEVFTQDYGSFCGVQGFNPTYPWLALHVLENCAAAVLVLHLREMLEPLPFSLAISQKCPCPPEPYCHGRNRSGPEKGKCRFLWLYVYQVVEGSLHRKGIILRNLGAHG